MDSNNESASFEIFFLIGGNTLLWPTSIPSPVLILSLVKNCTILVAHIVYLLDVKVSS